MGRYTSFSNTRRFLFDAISLVRSGKHLHTPLHARLLAFVPIPHRSFSLTFARSEIRLVLETLEPLPGDRKCFRMINGVLVERTVRDVVPALQTNAEGLKKVLDDLVKKYKTQQDELEKWKVRRQTDDSLLLS